ncbi:sigma 54-interacting transcriptional regulator [bacterium]|nr:sigma 54-interacting transcriptional regulator [bacterium]
MDLYVHEWGLLDSETQAELELLLESTNQPEYECSLIHSKLAWHHSVQRNSETSHSHVKEISSSFQDHPKVSTVLKAIQANELLLKSKTEEAYDALVEIGTDGLSTSYVARHLSLLGSVQRRLGHFDLAEQTLENARYLLSNDGGPILGLTLSRLGVLFGSQSEFVLSGRYFERAIQVFVEAKTLLWEIKARFNHAIALRKAGKMKLAKAEVARLVELKVEDGLQARYHNEYARLYIALEDKKTASYLLRLLEDYTDENTPIRSRVITCEAEADFHCLSRDWDHAMVALDRGIEKALTISKSNDLLAELYRRKARVLYEIGMDDEAYEMAKESLEVCHDVNEVYEIGANFRTLGLVAERRGDYPEAESLLEQAVNFYLSKDEKFERAHCHKDFAHFYHRIGNKDSLREAFKHAATAMGLFEEMGVETRVVEMRDLLEVLSKQIPRKPFIVPDGHQLVQIGEEYGIITGDEKVKQVLENMVRVSPTKSSILVTGETGTGKELVARAIHALSDRADEPMIVVNCAAIPRELMESEIFGHLKGSFTGAATDRVGKFALANNGTLFLDEIGDLDKHLQAKLLRVLEDGSYTPVGADKESYADVRVIAATNRNLDELIKKRQFREDLLYRLNDVMLQLPPLRERGGDAELLTLYFLHREGELMGNTVHIDPHALDMIVQHEWSGNIRELLAFVRQLILSAQESGLITVDLFPDHFFTKDSKEPKNLVEIVRKAERTAILEALIRAKGNKAKAARDLEVSRSTLGDKITRLGLDEELERIIERAEQRGER